MKKIFTKKQKQLVVSFDVSSFVKLVFDLRLDVSVILDLRCVVKLAPGRKEVPGS